MSLPSHLSGDLAGIPLAAALASAHLYGARHRILDELLAAKPGADLLDAHMMKGIGRNTIWILRNAYTKAQGIARARAHGIAIGLCPCEFEESNVGAEIAALVDDDCGEHIPGCAFIAEHGVEDRAEEVMP